MTRPLQDLAARLVTMARRRGATDADAVALADTSESVAVRRGQVESVSREDARGVGLRAFVGQSFATASTSDLSDAGLERLAARAVEMARISAPDPDAVPPSGADHPERLPAPEEPELWTPRQAREAALTAEAAALDHDPEIGNSEGAEAGFGTVALGYASADGFTGGYAKSSLGLGVSVIAGRGERMQRDHAFFRVRRAGDAPDPAAIGAEAAARAVRRLDPAGLGSRTTTVIFEPRVSVSLLGHLAGAINGRTVLQQRSFLADAAGERIFPERVRILDDPDHPEGLGNRPFDGEGTRTRRRAVVDAGRLTGFFTDRYAARRLGCEATGHARRGLTGDISVGPSNLVLEPGEGDVEALARRVGEGVLVTELLGFGVNGVTGDYSRGAAGFLIEGGEITRPLAEITVAGNLAEMFTRVADLGGDLTWFGSTAAPSVAIADMTVAGQA